jgi:hypothetical protein
LKPFIDIQILFLFLYKSRKVSSPCENQKPNIYNKGYERKMELETATPKPA